MSECELDGVVFGYETTMTICYDYERLDDTFTVDHVELFGAAIRFDALPPALQTDVERAVYEHLEAERVDDAMAGYEARRDER